MGALTISLRSLKSGISTRAGAPLRCLLVCVMGRDGYLRVVHSFQNLAQWLARVAILASGTPATFWILKVFHVPSETSGPAPIRIHDWIAYISMFGLLISEVLYELRFIVPRIACIRSAWTTRDK